MIGPYFTELHLQPHFAETNVTETDHFEQNAKVRNTQPSQFSLSKVIQIF